MDDIIRAMDDSSVPRKSTRAKKVKNTAASEITVEKAALEIANDIDLAKKAIEHLKKCADHCEALAGFAKSTAYEVVLFSVVEHCDSSIKVLEKLDKEFSASH